MREIASDDTQNLAAHGGLLASDSAPNLARVNGATDKASARYVDGGSGYRRGAICTSSDADRS